MNTISNSTLTKLGSLAIVCAAFAIVLWALDPDVPEPNSGQAASPAATPIRAATTPPAEVFPGSLTGTRRIELGEAILMLMPPAGTQAIGWDFLADEKVEWLTDGYEHDAQADYYRRQGLLRVDVGGVTATVLRKKKVELGWMVEFGSDQLPKMGVQVIKLAPGGSFRDGDFCFGSIYDHCAFDPRPSLLRQRIRAEPVCVAGHPGSNGQLLLRLTHPGRAPVLFKWTSSEGSGGSSAWIEMAIDEESAALKCSE